MSAQADSPSATTKKHEQAEGQDQGNNGWSGPGFLASGLYHEGSMVANRFGLQLARIATLQRAWRRRARPVDADLRESVDAFERDGVLLMENFLPDDVFAAVQAECRRAHDLGLYSPKDLDDGLVEEDCPVNQYKRDQMAATWAALGDNELLKRLAAAMTRRESIGRIKVEARIFTESKDTTMPERLSGSNLLHADVHYPTCKAWLYLNDIGERNGALVYSKGTQKMTRARLAYEYEASIRVARARKDGSHRRTISSAAARYPTDRQLTAMGHVDTHMAGKANTLVWANVQGFHRRGEFDDGAVREQIQIRFFDRPPDQA